MQMGLRASLSCLGLSLALGLALAPSAGARAQEDPELAALLAEERAEARALWKRGRPAAGLRILREHLDEDPQDASARTLLAEIRLDQGATLEALSEAEAALDTAATGAQGADASRVLGEVQVALGRPRPAVDRLTGPLHGGRRDARDAWALVQALDELGDRPKAQSVALEASRLPAAGPEQAVALARLRQRAGDLPGAAEVLVAADRAAGGRDADVLVALAAVYFESEQEVEAPGQRSVGLLLREALERSPGHREALLLQFELHRLNRLRRSRSPEEILGELLDGRPDCIQALVVATEGDLADGQLVRARQRLARLEQLAPDRRDVCALQATLAWIEHRRPDCMAILEQLAESGPADSRPERTVGSLLLQLYRFAEAVPFLQRATERDPSDHVAWALLGRAQANTGDEVSGLASLEKAEVAAKGRQDAQRHNLKLVLERMAGDTVEHDAGDFTFVWADDAAAVFEVYLVPFYREAREVFAQRYGHTPARTRVEVFRRFGDFSVRSVGFEGFPALGVCFGPVVTSVSPLAEIRGSFSWARTAWHEFSHVVHLGLSHNRCPRWITEGLATWEETERNPGWTRNMRRELVDALYGGDLIPVRELNRAFRGSRILFGYYQGGLLCEMLIADHGFAPMVGLLEAFDEGLDLDQAFQRELGASPEEIDVRFRAFCEERFGVLEIEPRHDPRSLLRRSLTLGKQPPEGAEARAAWQEEWLNLAWGRWQQRARVDAEEALRVVALAGEEPARARFLRAEMALAEKDPERALELLDEGIALGGREYRALMTFGKLLEREKRWEEALSAYEEAELAFPGFDQADLSAERSQATLLEGQGRLEEAMGAWERWLAWNPGEYDLRLRVAAWHAEAGRHEEACARLAEANDVDPFRRDLHLAWGRSLMALERFEEAERELRVTLLVPAELDRDHGVVLTSGPGLPPGAVPGTLPPRVRRQLAEEGGLRITPLEGAERAEVLRLLADALEELGRTEEAQARRLQAEQAEGE